MPAALPPLSTLGEFGLIRYLGHRFGHTGSAVRRGIGDDAAVFQPQSGRELLVTTDLLTEGIHFDHRTASYADIGYKAAVASLSDIAAMGGVPRYVLVSMAIPPNRDARDIAQLYQGLMQACRIHRVELIGGDTSASGQGLFVNIMLIGSIKPRHALMRTGARAGDVLCVSGTLGDSRAGLNLLDTRHSRARAAKKLAARHRRFLITRHLRPTARLRLGQLLASSRLATAAIDVSDGLAGDLSHLCEQSDVGADIDTAALPSSSASRAYAALHHVDPAQLALSGGEDYELLFTVRPQSLDKVKRLASEAGCEVSRIGVMKSRANGLRVRDGAGSRRLTLRSYDHFRNGRGKKPVRQT
jgi:thiamine-monophosphate kinase